MNRSERPGDLTLRRACKALKAAQADTRLAKLLDFPDLASLLDHSLMVDKTRALAWLSTYTDHIEQAFFHEGIENGEVSKLGLAIEDVMDRFRDLEMELMESLSP